MPESFKIKSSQNSYDVEIINEGYLSKISDLSSPKSIIICDAFVAQSYGICDISANVITVDSNESVKDIDNISDVISKIKSYGLKRDGLLIAVGGGVIQDITCFIASIYMRGIKWLYFPTTFLGMCDSCIGGKSSINVGDAKNLVGTFYPPERITIDSAFCKTLPKFEIFSGLFEAVKILFATKIRDSDFDKYQELFNITKLDKNFNEIINCTIRAKKWFIEVDEFDKKERQLLNFGHCFGHAIESASKYQIPHGIAVGLGMLWAVYFSKKIHNIDDIDYINVFVTIILNILKNNTKYIETLMNLESPDILAFFKNDKKHSFDKYSVVLPNLDGVPEKFMFNKDKIFEESFQVSYKVFVKELNKLL